MSKSRTRFADLCLAVFRANALAQAGAKIPTRASELRASSSAATSAAHSAADYAAADAANAAAEASFAAHFAASIVSRIDDFAADTAQGQAASSASASASANATSYNDAYASSTAYSAAFARVRRDATVLEADGNPIRLMDLALWPRAEPKPRNLRLFRASSGRPAIRVRSRCVSKFPAEFEAAYERGVWSVGNSARCTLNGHDAVVNDPDAINHPAKLDKGAAEKLRDLVQTFNQLVLRVRQRQRGNCCSEAVD